MLISGQQELRPPEDLQRVTDLQARAAAWQLK